MSQDIEIVSQVKEWFNNIYTPKSHTHNANQINDLKEAMYPVGSIYTTTKSDNPSSLLGFGYWSKIEDKFLLGAGNSYTAGTTGGAATVTLTANQSGLKVHNHTIAHSHTPSDTSRNFMSRTNHSHGITETGSPTGTHHYVPKIASSDNWYGVTAIPQSTTTTGSNTAANASEAHNNMPPYKVVNIWERISENRYNYNNLEIINIRCYNYGDVNLLYIYFNNNFINKYYEQDITTSPSGDIFIYDTGTLEIDIYTVTPNSVTITFPSITVDGETFPTKTLTSNNINVINVN